MIVLDASALVDWALQGPSSGAAVAGAMRRARFLHTLDLATAEALSALRRDVARGRLQEARAEQALHDLSRLPIRRHRLTRLTPRIWELRRSLSSYDAAYVALAERLSSPLLTTDRHLARSRGHSAEIVDATAV